MIKKILIPSAFILFSSYATAALVPIVSTPTTWRLQNYVGDTVAAFFTGSACTNGQLVLGAGATKDDKNRFWSLIMTAKVSGKPVVVYYDDTAAPNQCIVKSFLLKEEQLN